MAPCPPQAKKGIKRIGEGGPQPLASNVQEAEARFAAALLSSVQGLNAIRSSRLEKCCREMQQLEAHAELSARAAVGIDDKHELLRTLVHFHGKQGFQKKAQDSKQARSPRLSPARSAAVRGGRAGVRRGAGRAGGACRRVGVARNKQRSSFDGLPASAPAAQAASSISWV